MSIEAISSITDSTSLPPLDASLSPLEKKTDQVAQEALKNINTTSKAPLDPEKVLLQSSLESAIAVLNAGIEFEKWSTHQLREMDAASNNIVDAIEKLLDLSRELSALDNENPKSNEKIANLLQELKEKQIHLLTTDGKTLTKDQLLSLKSSLGSHIEKSRTKIQQLFTKMQTVVQNMTSVNDTIKKILNDLSDLIRKILENGRRH